MGKGKEPNPIDGLAKALADTSVDSWLTVSRLGGHLLSLQRIRCVGEVYPCGGMCWCNVVAKALVDKCLRRCASSALADKLVVCWHCVLTDTLDDGSVGSHSLSLPTNS